MCNEVMQKAQAQPDQSPHDTFVVFAGRDSFLDQFYNEHHARSFAAQFARNHRGLTIQIAKVIASVTEPLPELAWTGDPPSAPEPSKVPMNSASTRVMGEYNPDGIHPQKSAY